MRAKKQMKPKPVPVFVKNEPRTEPKPVPLFVKPLP
jgi:hypothetical protein